jgi:hypothetical protein
MRERIAVSAFALALLAGILGASFALGYILGKLLL